MHETELCRDLNCVGNSIVGGTELYVELNCVWNWTVYGTKLCMELNSVQIWTFERTESWMKLNWVNLNFVWIWTPCVWNWIVYGVELSMEEFFFTRGITFLLICSINKSPPLSPSWERGVRNNFVIDSVSILYWYVENIFTQHSWFIRWLSTNLTVSGKEFWIEM